MNKRRISRGFTLVEMIVVLAILAVVATIAVNSLEGKQDQTRYDATKQTMENVQDAIVGSSGQQPAPSFVGDVGRLPNAYRAKNPDGTDALKPDGSIALDPVELWSNPANIDAFGLKVASKANTTNVFTDNGTLTPAAFNDTLAPGGDDDPEVFVECGWRGPYVRLGVGEINLRDGWGNFYDLLTPARADCALLAPVAIIRSRGANNALDNASTASYAEDLYVNFATNQFTLPANYPAVDQLDRVTALKTTAPVAPALTITVKNADGSALVTGTVTVKCFCPDPTSGKIKIINPTTQTAGTETTSLTFTINDPSMTIGPKVVRAYSGSGTKSAVTRVVLHAGGNSQDLFLK